MARRARGATAEDPATESAQGGPSGAEADGSRNQVSLVGRLSGVPAERELPSGDRLTTFRVVVSRPPARAGAPEGVRRTTSDTLDCVAWAAGLRRRVASLHAGDVLEVEGSLRRRFWRGGQGVSSRYEVEVTSIKRLRKGPHDE
ncbi:MAG: Single-stranded DNA-binding protein [Frankiales bacterium]|nr:Single-stranded DNA-binding protein [Frankiales bacterium]